jgi:RimJ/RimL family protein N-acetyltransferase
LQSGSRNSIKLRPIKDADLPWLFEMYTCESVAFRWLLEGELSTYKEFSQTPLGGFFRAFALDDSGGPIGLAVVGPADEKNGTASFGICLRPGEIGKGKGVRGTALLCHYLFRELKFRKVYTQTIDFNFTSHFRGLTKYMRLEGCLRGHHYFLGRYWDVHILSLFREDWETWPQYLRASTRECWTAAR